MPVADVCRDVICKSEANCSVGRRGDRARLRGAQVASYVAGEWIRDDMGGNMASTTKSVDVNVPVRTAYNQWTQFEEFPRFMEGVESVTQLDDKRLHWCATIAGNKQEW